MELAGSTGNIYTVHIVYVLAWVLRAKFQYVYQLALLSSELEEIFNNASPIIEDKNSDAAKAECDKERKLLKGIAPSVSPRWRRTSPPASSGAVRLAARTFTSIASRCGRPQNGSRMGPREKSLAPTAGVYGKAMKTWSNRSRRAK